MFRPALLGRTPRLRVPVRRATRTGTLAVIAIGAAAIGLAGCSAGTAGGTPPPVIDVTATEFRFEPATINVAAGTVTFHVTNIGVAEHEFEILKGDQTVSEIEGLVPGLEKSLTVSLSPGEYLFACHLPGHFEQGMKGTLTVRP